MSYLYVGLGCFAAGCVLDALYQKRVVSAARHEADALRGILDSYKQHLSELFGVLKAKL